MKTLTIHCQLLAKENDLMDYQTLVFKNLDKAPFGLNYCMVTVWPNWESYIPNIGEKGYLTYDSVTAGVDTYYDRKLDSIVKYNFTNLVFNKFVKEKDNYTKDVIIM
jgi:hypothetical protein